MELFVLLVIWVGYLLGKLVLFVLELGLHRDPKATILVFLVMFVLELGRLARTRELASSPPSSELIYFILICLLWKLAIDAVDYVITELILFVRFRLQHR